MPVYLHVLTCTALNWMYNLRVIARKEIQNATDGAGLSGNVMHFEGRSLNTRIIFIKIF